MKRRSCLFPCISFLLIALVLALAYSFENWRGTRAWTVARQELAAKGESLDWQHFIPPPVPDDQNLALTPFYARELAYQPDAKTGFYTFGPVSSRPNTLKDLPFASFHATAIPSPGRMPTGRTDLDAYAKFFRQTAGFRHSDQPNAPAAEEILTALTRYAPTLDELARAAAARPLVHFPIPWHSSDPLALAFPHSHLQQQIVTTLSLRASARLAAGQSADALRDVELACRLCRDVGSEPTLLAYLVQSTCLRILLVPVWEGLADRRWSPAELARLQGELGRFDLIAGYRLAIRCERLLVVTVEIDYLRTHLGVGILSMQGTDSESVWTASRVLGYAAPRGWYDANRALQARFMQTYNVEAVDPAAHRIFPDRFAVGNSVAAAIPNRPTTVLAKTGLPVYTSLARRAFHTQVSLDEAATACALERFYAERQVYPDTLAELVPACFDHPPIDLADGAPLRYVRTLEGRYRLYSVGWNARDDGGKIEWISSSPPRQDDAKGDWVWQYEPFQPPPPASAQRSK